MLPVTSQLETDPELLIPKSRTALSRYGHQVVIGNDLHRRKFEVVFVARGTIPGIPSNTPVPPPTSAQAPVSGSATISSPASSSQARDLNTGEITQTWLRLKEDDVAAGMEIEENIIDELVRMHSAWVERGSVEAVNPSAS